MWALTVVLLSLSGDVSMGRSARLVDDAPVLAQADAPLAPASMLQLQADLAALRRMKVSLAGPAALLSVGLGFSLFGGMFIVLDTVLIGGFAASSPILVMGLIGVGIGAPMLVLGAWLLWQRLDERAHIAQVTNELQRQLREQQRGGPRGELPVRVPSVTLARF